MEKQLIQIIPERMNQQNYKPQACKKRVSTISDTVPNQSMSVEAVLERFTRGLPIYGANGEPQYGVDPFNGLHPNSFDLSERMDMVEEATQRVESIRKQLLEQSSNKEKEALKTQLKAEMEEAEKKRKLQTDNPKPNPEGQQ